MIEMTPLRGTLPPFGREVPPVPPNVTKRSTFVEGSLSRKREDDTLI